MLWNVVLSFPCSLIRSKAGDLEFLVERGNKKMGKQSHSLVELISTCEKRALPHHRRCGSDKGKPLGKTKLNPPHRRRRRIRELNSPRTPFFSAPLFFLSFLTNSG